jgi:hypothetical protein
MMANLGLVGGLDQLGLSRSARTTSSTWVVACIEAVFAPLVPAPWRCLQSMPGLVQTCPQYDWHCEVQTTVAGWRVRWLRLCICVLLLPLAEVHGMLRSPRLQNMLEQVG